jgi:hypothetical protein
MPITFRFENCSSQDIKEITARANRIIALAPELAKTTKLNPDLKKWFGAGADQALKKIKIMSDYLTKKCKILTFKKLVLGGKCDGAPVEIGDYGQVIPTVQTRYLKEDDLAKVPSGLRIFLSPYYFSVNATEYEKDNCIYHELTHKIIMTVDYRYGPSECEWLAKNFPGSVHKNADNYGYLIADLAQDLEQGDAIGKLFG